MGSQRGVVSHHVVHLCPRAAHQAHCGMERKARCDPLDGRLHHRALHLFRGKPLPQEYSHVLMKLLVIGLNHKTASVDLRERFAFTGPRLEEAVTRLRGLPEVKEAAVLSTCNRVEL